LKIEQQLIEDDLGVWHPDEEADGEYVFIPAQ